MKVKATRYATNITPKGKPERKSDKQATVEWDVSIKYGYINIQTETGHVYNINPIELDLK